MHAAPLLPILDPRLGWWNQLWVYEPVWEQRKLISASVFCRYWSQCTQELIHNKQPKDASSCPQTNVPNCFTFYVGKSFSAWFIGKYYSFSCTKTIIEMFSQLHISRNYSTNWSCPWGYSGTSCAFPVEWNSCHIWRVLFSTLQWPHATDPFGIVKKVLSYNDFG